MRSACYHAVKGYLPGRHPRYGSYVSILAQARKLHKQFKNGIAADNIVEEECQYTK